MCGRVAVKKGLEGLVIEYLEAVGKGDEWASPRANIAPTNPIPGVRLEDGVRIASSYLWGFLPPNAPSTSFVSEYFTFNARSDKIATGRLYSKPFRHQRCLLTVSAWYEWPKASGAKKGTPCTLVPTTGDLLVFAGLWGAWHNPKTDQDQDTATVITVDPNELVADLPHHRMPAILPSSEWAAWLDPATPTDALLKMLKPCPSAWLNAQVGGPQNFNLD
jgi:putative SOS response-associated peptidase YedK